MLFSDFVIIILSYVLFFLIGGLGGVIQSTLSAMITDINLRNERRAVTFVQVFFGIVAVVGPGFARWLVSSDYPGQIVYTVASVFAFIATILVSLYQFPKVKAGGKMEFAAFKEILGHKEFLLLCTAVALYVGIETAV